MDKRIKKAFSEGKENIVLESLYSWEEYKLVKEEFQEIFFVISVITPFEIRAKRLKKRFDERPLKIEETKSRDYAQIENLHQAGPIAYADFPIINITTIDYIYKKIDKALEIIKKN